MQKSYNTYIKKEFEIIKKIDENSRLIEYYIYNNLNILAERKIVLLEILNDFKKNHYEEFYKFGLKYSIPNIDIIITIGFHDARNFFVEEKKVGYKKLKVEFDDKEFYDLIIMVESNIINIEENYQVEYYTHMTVKIV